jgi:hypothetical protein
LGTNACPRRTPRLVEGRVVLILHSRPAVKQSLATAQFQLRLHQTDYLSFADVCGARISNYS